MVLMIPLLVTSVLAAEVTDARWVTRNDAPIPFVRIVLDLDKPVSADAVIDKSGTNTTITLKNSTMPKAPKILNMNKSIAPTATLTEQGKDVKVSIRTAQVIDVDNLKVFSLKNDVSQNKPYRLVIDVQKVGVAPKSDYYGSPKKPKTPTPAPAKTNKPWTQPAPKASTYRVNGGIAGKVIVLDPGHGGSDPGAIGQSGLMEKQVTLPVAKYLKDILEARGAKVILTRTTDVDVFGPHASGPDELQARSNVANYNNADAFVSIHINSFTNPNVGGIATYYYDKTPHDLRLANRVQEEIANESGFDGDRGVQPGDLYVLRNTDMPAILVELGFISNRQEENLLKTEETRRDFAAHIADGLTAYFRG